VRDLVPKEGAVDPDNGFAMKYPALEKNERHVETIAPLAAQGEGAVSGHRPGSRGRGDRLAPEGNAERAPAISTARTCTAWCSTKSRATPSVRRSGNRAACRSELVNAQQARARARLSRRLQSLAAAVEERCAAGLSAGRVQSPALRMICEREEEIGAFVAQEYWTIEGEGSHSSQSFPLKLLEYRGQKVEQFSFTKRDPGRRRSSATSGRAAARAPRGARVARARDRSQAAPPQSGPALHHLDAAAGGGPQARLQRPAHHASARSSCTRDRTSAKAAWA